MRVTQKRNLSKQVMVMFLVLAVLWLVACGGGGASPSPSGSDASEGDALLQARCTQCHGLDKVEGAQKTPEQWEQTIVRMVEKGATLSAEEQTTLVDYLAETYGP